MMTGRRSSKNVLATGVVFCCLTVSAPASSLPGDTSQDWLSRVQREIANSEYEVTWQSADKLADLGY